MTTNSLEAWHRALQYNMGTQDGKKPQFFKWLGQLKAECSLQEANLTRYETGNLPKLNAADKKLNEKRERMVASFNGNDLLPYINNHSLVTRLEHC